jgi:hypothetical protein
LSYPGLRTKYVSFQRTKFKKWQKYPLFTFNQNQSEVFIFILKFFFLYNLQKNFFVCQELALKFFC